MSGMTFGTMHFDCTVSIPYAMKMKKYSTILGGVDCAEDSNEDGE